MRAEYALRWDLGACPTRLGVHDEGLVEFELTITQRLCREPGCGGGRFLRLYRSDGRARPGWPAIRVPTLVPHGTPHNKVLH